jgi:hypothetical protein
MTNLHPLMAGILAAHGAPAPRPIVPDDVIEALELAASYFDRFADVSDGDYGVPEPNEEMRLLDVMKRALALVEG